jgi:hypothetical protein
MKADAKNPFDLLKSPVSSKVNIVRMKPSKGPIVNRFAVDDCSPADITASTAIVNVFTDSTADINVIPPADITASADIIPVFPPAAVTADITASAGITPVFPPAAVTADITASAGITPISPATVIVSTANVTDIRPADVTGIDSVTPLAVKPVYVTGTAASASQTPPGIAIVRRGDIGASYAATFVSPERSKREADREVEVLSTPTKKSKADDSATVQNSPSSESITSPRQALGQVSSNVVNSATKHIDIYLATPEEDRIHLDCPFHDREYAKKMGAIWIPEPIEKWFINRKHKSFKRGWMYWWVIFLFILFIIFIILTYWFINVSKYLY